MGNGLLLALVLGSLVPNASAVYRTRNFEVQAPSGEIARRIGEAAERLRKEKARLWLGKELPAWSSRCPLRVTISLNGNAGATTFAFDGGKILSRTIQIEGSLDRLLESTLPHEITHTILADHFLCPVPRWADEGAAILSEDAIERKRHHTMIRQMLKTPGRAIPLRRLFKLNEYPRDVMVLYAQGYSVTRFLVRAKDYKTFLAFVKAGLSGDWDRAVRTHYGYASVDKLEEAWLKEFSEVRAMSRAIVRARDRKQWPDWEAFAKRHLLPPVPPGL
jgi:hypothetical protein